MIILDMDMPKKCSQCNFAVYDREGDRFFCKQQDGSNKISQWFDWHNLGEQKTKIGCPIKCDIEDIKAEILGLMSHDDYMVDGFDVLDIIDKHTKGDKG